METERVSGGEKERERAKRQGEDRSRSWAIVTSIDPISCCLFAHSPLCIKGAVQAAGRPRALHLITWHANRCYGLIRTPRPPSLCIYDYLRTKKKGRWRWCGQRRGWNGEKEGGEEIKYFMMAWCRGKKWNRLKWSVCVDGGGRRLKKGTREGKMVGTHSFVLYEVVNGLAVLPGPVLFVSVLIGLFHKRFCTIVIKQW